MYEYHCQETNSWLIDLWHSITYEANILYGSVSGGLDVQQERIFLNSKFNDSLGKKTVEFLACWGKKRREQKAYRFASAQ